VTRPLEGIRVVEFGQVAAGPFTGMLLADMGADVVKIEPPGGDALRGWPPFAEIDDQKFSHGFSSLNRNKRSIVLDLNDEEDVQTCRRLCMKAEVLVENNRPGVMERFGLDFPTLSSEHTGLVYCSISGFGQSGPYRDRGAFDVVIQGMCGLMSVTGQPGDPPIKSGVPVADFTAGLYAAFTIAAFLPFTRQTGRSYHIDCPMLDCMLGVSALQTSEYWGTGTAPQRRGSAHPRNAPYQAFPASDGHFVLAAGNHSLWVRLCEHLGLDALIADDRFATQEKRAENQTLLAEILSDTFVTRPADEWIDSLTRIGIPCGPVNSFADVLEDPSLYESGLIQGARGPGMEQFPLVAHPARVVGAPAQTAGPAPLLGADGPEILVDWLT